MERQLCADITLFAMAEDVAHFIPGSPRWFYRVLTQKDACVLMALVTAKLPRYLLSARRLDRRDNYCLEDLDEPRRARCRLV